MTAPAPSPAPTPTPSPSPAPQPTPAPSPTPGRWYEPLGEGYQHASFERMAAEDMVSVPRTLVKSYIESQRSLSQDRMPVPREDWTDTDWESHYERLGVPKIGKDANPLEVYGLERPADIPKDLPIDENVERELVGIMARHKLTKKQAEGVYQDYFNLIGKNWGEITKITKDLTESGIQGLRDEWGGNFDARINLANRAMLNAVGGDQKKADVLRTLVLADGTHLGDHPAVIRAFAALGQAGAEHGFIGHDTGTPMGDFAMTAEQAARKYRELHTKFMGMNRQDPNYKATADEMERNLRIAGEKINEV